MRRGEHIWQALMIQNTHFLPNPLRIWIPIWSRHSGCRYLYLKSSNEYAGWHECVSSVMKQYNMCMQQQCL